MERRPSPFTWVTWISGLLSGDKHCRYAAWLRTHYQTTKRPQSDEDEARLRTWAGDHADLVRSRQADLEADGWTVRVEKQNKFLLKGRATTLSGCPDIVAYRDVPEPPPMLRALDLGEPLDAPTGSGHAVRQALVVDAKTGAKRDSDHWQVVIYALFLPTESTPLEGRTIDGEIAYKDRRVRIDAAHMGQPAIMARIVALLREVGGTTELPATPSVDECRWCDIAECRHRVTAETAPVQTESF